ncbi:MAG: hypothetical protein JO235_10070 [Chroococcidiopsidaceae cyanobacterium CP_BM_RX_35]|nr:hypothetical protein [Chroococcidiopsidaceae cyanobacterium CP_BM_RX_35]
MNKLVLAALLGLATVSTSLLSPQAVKADEVIGGNYVTSRQAPRDYWAADHPRAYADGYRQGEQSARDKEAYRPRTAGGEFARGFEDGYFNRPYTGQKVVVLPPPAVYYNYPNPAINLDFGFGFGGWHHRW